MFRSRVVTTSFFAFGLVASFGGTAWAQDPAAATPPAVAVSTETAKPGEMSDGRPSDDPFRSIALTLNPISLAIGRIGLNAEWLPTTHHAIVLNPFGQFTSAGSEGDVGGKTSYSNFGAELGYRLYTGSRGANGFFVGPFVTALTSSSKTSINYQGTKSEGSTTFFAYGGGLDLGGQHVFKNGFTIGGGAGIMYLASSASSTGASSSTVKFEGVLPRFLFTAGYSF